MIPLLRGDETLPRYGFDAVRTMFAKGNGSERMRYGRLDCRGETVVDLYAGIGYFTIPLLAKAGAAFVHCCEWAPAALEALARNLEANGVADDRYAIHSGDNAVTTPKLGRVAHRVSLGLTPSSKSGWSQACCVLREEGGVLHVHENVRVPRGPAAETRAAFDDWGRGVAGDIADILRFRRGLRWQARCVHVSHVKDYAPRVHHLVADVVCRPEGEHK